MSDVQPVDEVEDYALSAAKQIEENSILCVRCGRSLDNLEEVSREGAASFGALSEFKTRVEMMKSESSIRATPSTRRAQDLKGMRR